MIEKLVPGERYFGTAFDPQSEPKNSYPAALQLKVDGRVELELLESEPRSGTSSSADSPWHQQVCATSPAFFVFSGQSVGALLYGCQLIRDELGYRAGRFLTFAIEFCVVGETDFPGHGSAGTTRSEITGLFSWVGEAAIESSRTFDGDGGVERVELRTLDHSATALHKTDSHTVSVESKWGYASRRFGPLGPTVQLRSIGTVQVELCEPDLWRPNLHIHEMIRDLLSISRWFPEEIVECQVTFDLHRHSLEHERDRKWCVLQGWDAIGGGASTEPRNPHLYPFEDLQPAGMGRWIDLYSNRSFRRVITRLNTILRSRPDAYHKLTLVGLAIEALAHFIVTEIDTQPKKTQSISQCCGRLLKYTRSISSDEVPHGWARFFADNYNDYKHSEKKYQAGDFEVMQASGVGLYLIRLAIGKILGVSEEELSKRRIYDPLFPVHFTYGLSLDPGDQWKQIEECKRVE